MYCIHGKLWNFLNIQNAQNVWILISFFYRAFIYTLIQWRCRNLVASWIKLNHLNSIEYKINPFITLIWHFLIWTIPVVIIYTKIPINKDLKINFLKLFLKMAAIGMYWFHKNVLPYFLENCLPDVCRYVCLYCCVYRI